MRARGQGALSHGISPMKNEAVGAVIMASGLARRFGSNKLLADFGGEPMLCRALAQRAGIAPRLVVTRSGEVHRLCTALGVPALLHALPHRSDTVRLGLDALLRGDALVCGCLFVPGDQLLLRESTVAGCAARFVLAGKGADDLPSGLARNGCARLIGSPVLFGRAYLTRCCICPRARAAAWWCGGTRRCVRLFAAAHPAETEDADTPD